MPQENTPIIAGALFCNSASEGEDGKINCVGIFTSFLAWDYPTAVRTWYTVFTIHDLPDKHAKLTIAISLGNEKRVHLADVDIPEKKGDLGSVVMIPLQYKFPKEGLYTLHLSMVDFNASLETPVKVTTQPWPKFTEKQLDFLRKNSSIPHSIRVTVVCSKCNRPQIFEEVILPEDELSEGVLPFSKSGNLKCEGESCVHTLHLKDIQGRMRSSIKKAVLSAMRRRK